MTVLLFIAALIFAAILVPFQVIAGCLVVLGMQAVLIQVAAHFIMGGVPFIKAFKASVWSTVSILVMAMAVMPVLLGGVGILLGSVIAFSAIWVASVVAYSLALEATFGTSAAIALLTTFFAYIATSMF